MKAKKTQLTKEQLSEKYKEWLGGQVMEKQIKYFRPEIKAVDEKNHTIEAVITTNQKDRDNEVIQTSAWKDNIQSYMQHPVLISSHNYMDLRKQIGEALSINFYDNDVVMKFKYYVGDGNPEADWAWVLASKGMAMFSVGFKPIEWLDGEEVRALHIDDDNPPIREFTKAELLEVSQVLVGSNRGALQLGIDNPNTEQCQYMYEVVKSFSDKIPDWTENKNTKSEHNHNQTVICEKCKNSFDYGKEPEVSMGAVKCPKCDAIIDQTGKECKEKIPEIKTEDIILPIKFDIKSIKEAEQVISIMKSGRVLSEKNRSLIKNCSDVLEQAIKSLKELLEATQPAVDEEAEAEKSKKMLELQQAIDEMLVKVKSK